ncbi:helix-turn-helix domain-containing protein [Nocardia sp. NPDC050630]|uniref:helix-turn-helix domain-containing protein n=1 Tax=Nocardia sp. NPDC050630 TaxID=3364321 RepID=UPI0037B2E7B7
MTGTALSQTCGAPVVWTRPGHVGYLGPELGVGMHATSIAYLGLSLDGPFAVETAADVAIITRSVFIPARVPARIVSEGRIALLFVEPGSAMIAGVTTGSGSNVESAAVDPSAEAVLITAARAGVAELERLISVPRSAIDPRIEAIVRDMRDDPTTHIRAEAAAEAAGMSETHFLRTFVAHTGTTFRRYRQWARLRMVFASLSAGHDLTRCAADAGFASPSHLSETFRRTFGLSLTELLSSSVTFDIR